MNINIKNILIVAALPLLLLAFSNKAAASHLAAGEIYITYIGSGSDGCENSNELKYQVTLDVYRACEGGGSAPTSASIPYGSVNGNFSSSLTIQVTPENRDTVHDLCPAFYPQNSCITPANQNTFPAYIRHRFVDTIILPSRQTDWKFSYSLCCRNGGITNGSRNLNMYIETVFNNFTRLENSSPRFRIQPLPYICAGQPASYINSPYDFNDDSLFTTVVEPLSAANTPIAYAPTPPYSLADPMESAGGVFNFDNVTATASFTPVNQGKYVLAFKCEEFDRATGVSLGYVLRDAQVSVFNCNAPPPVVEREPQVINSAKQYISKNDTSDKIILTCVGSNISFPLSAQTSSSTSQIYMYSDLGPNNMPAATFNVVGNGTTQCTGTFDWTPTLDDVGDHTLTVYSVDSTCSGSTFAIVLRSVAEYKIKVVEGVDGGADLPICEIDPQPVQLYMRNGEILEKYELEPLKWSTVSGGPIDALSDPNIHNPTALPSVTTGYILTKQVLQGVGNCKSSDTVYVYYDTSNRVTITPKNPVDSTNALVMCRPGYLQIEALLEGKPPKDNLNCGTGNPTECSTTDLLSSTTYGSQVYGTRTQDSVGQVSPALFTRFRTSKQQYIVRRDELVRAGMSSGTIRKMSFETSGNNEPDWVYANFKILIKCTDKSELNPAEGFENFGFTEVFSASSTTFPDGIHEYTLNQPYNWDTTKNIMIQICYSHNPDFEDSCGLSTKKPPVIVYATTTYTAGLKATGADENVQSVCDMAQDPSIVGVSARPVFTFDYCEADPEDFIITWTEGEFLSDSAILQPLAYVPKSERFVIETIGRSTCVMRDTLDVYVPDYEYDIEPKDTTLCLGDAAPFFITGGGFYFKWYEYNEGQYELASSVLEPNKGNTFIAPQKTTEYRIVVSDSVWCYDTIATKINILPLPDVRILNEDDTVVKYGQQFQLLASGAKFFNWSPVSSLNNPNISYPIARPTEDTKYIVGGIGSNGCRAFDTLHVNVDKKDNLFVPTAFSPNGDGKNDFFKIANLSFQRVMEFRVFNRWGQEVYSGSGQSAAWDGRFENKEQPIDSYNYLIRVAYPDGFVETYKGETTLIR